MNEALYTGKLNLRTNPLLPRIDTNANNKKPDAKKKEDKKEDKKENKTETAPNIYKEPKKIERSVIFCYCSW